MTNRLTPTALAEQSLASVRRSGSSAGSAEASSSSIRLLGPDVGTSATSSRSVGSYAGAGPLEHSRICELPTSRGGTCMDSIDDEWDSDEADKTAEQKVKDPSAVRLSSPSLSSVGFPRPSSAPPASTAARFSSPLGLSAPGKTPLASTATAPSTPAAKPTDKREETKESRLTKNGATAATIEAVSRLAATTDESAQPDVIVRNSNPDLSAPKHPLQGTSKVQLVAEAFRQRAGIKKSSVRPSAQPPAVVKVEVQTAMPQQVVPIAPISDVKTPESPTVIISPVVVLEEPLELHEVKPSTQVVAEVPPALPEEMPRTESPTTLSGLPVAGMQPAGASGATAVDEIPIEISTDVIAPLKNKPAESVESDASSSGLSGNQEHQDLAPSVPSISSVRDSSLSLESSYAVEFFSTPPKPQHFEADPEPIVVHDPRSIRTPEQRARQRALQRVVLRSMLILCAFILVVFYLLWQ